MFHKTIIFILSIALLLGLSACTVKEESSAESIPSAEINGEEEQLSKKLVPLDYQEGEEVESLYYRINKVDGQLCYEVQPEGEKERMQIPVDSVIYIVSSPDECRIEKVSFDYTPEDGETQTIEQYRIYVTSNSGVETDPGEASTSSGSSSEGNDANESSSVTGASSEQGATTSNVDEKNA